MTKVTKSLKKCHWILLINTWSKLLNDNYNTFYIKVHTREKKYNNPQNTPKKNSLLYKTFLVPKSCHLILINLLTYRNYSGYPMTQK